MSDTSQTITPPWWASKTIWTQGFAAFLVVFNVFGAKYGIQIDGTKWADTLAGDAVDIATLLTLMYGAYRHQLSKKATVLTVPLPVTVDTGTTTVAMTSQPTPPAAKTD